MRSRVCSWSLVLLACALMSGCEPVHALFPLYKAEDSVLDRHLVGAWRYAKPESDEDKAGRWYFSESGDKKSYDFKWGAVGAKGGFLAKARLVRLGNVIFIDFEGDGNALDDEAQKDNLTPYPVISTHMMGRIWLTDRTVEVHFLKEDWVKAQMKAGNFPLGSLNVEGTPILTAQTEDLRKFMEGHADDEAALSENFSLVREK